MVNINFSFSKIPEIHFGPGKLEKLPDLINKFGSNIIIVTGSHSFNSSPNCLQFTETLKKSNVNYYLEYVKGEPSPLFIDKTVQKYKDKNIDLVVGIGGGSVIDSGKAISAMLLKEGSVKQYLEGMECRKHNGVKIPFIAVPTSSGTGAEATKNAVLSEIGRDGFKSSLRHNNFVPDIALIDPELTLTCPKDITAACGMDAFTQLLEAYVSTKASPLTDSLALDGIKHFKEGYISSYLCGKTDINARSNMSYAALISGIVLANAGLGVVHGFASSIGGCFNIPHGVICGSLVGAASEMNISVMLKNPELNSAALIKYARAGTLLSGSEPSTLENDCRLLLEIINNMIEETSIPKLGIYGVTSSDIIKIVEKTSNKNNPVNLDKNQLASILASRI